MRLHPTSEEEPPTSHMGRDRAPRAGPATRTWGTRGDVARAGDMPSMRVLLAGGGNGAQRSFLPGLHPGGPLGEGVRSRGLWGLWMRHREGVLPRGTCTNWSSARPAPRPPLQ